MNYFLFLNCFISGVHVHQKVTNLHVMIAMVEETTTPSMFMVVVTDTTPNSSSMGVGIEDGDLIMEVMEELVSIVVVDGASVDVVGGGSVGAVDGGMEEAVGLTAFEEVMALLEVVALTEVGVMMIETVPMGLGGGVVFMVLKLTITRKWMTQI